MIDDAAVLATDAVRFQRLLYRDGVVAQCIAMGDIQRCRRLLGDEEPVAAPGDVALDLADAGHLHFGIGNEAIALDVVDGYLAVDMQRDTHHADRCLDQVFARLNAAHMRQRPGQADGAVATHAQIADIVEEDHACTAARIGGLQQQRTDHRVRTARLAGDGAAPMIVAVAEDFAALRKASLAQVREARHDDSRGFARSV
ncbi:hypothetical protein D3C81_1095400 [compost metagenome]